MTSQLNNANENQDQVLQELESLRPLFFENAPKRSPPPTSDGQQRLRLDLAVEPPHIVQEQTRSSDEQHILTSLTPSETTLMELVPSQIAHTHLILQHHRILSQPDLDGVSGTDVVSGGTRSAHFTLQAKEPVKARKNLSPRAQHLVKKVLPSAGGGTATKNPKLYRRFRSRSLPIINYTLRSQVAPAGLFRCTGDAAQNESPHGSGCGTHRAPLHSSSNASRAAKASDHAIHRHIPTFGVAPLLPPINLQLLKEIDLQEILKNPQLRHDILFDPQLQFRPNLDGERGRRKKTVIERYWVEIELECKQFFDSKEIRAASSKIPPKATRLRALFTTLREILLSLLPMKDRQPVNEIMDVDLIIQQLNYGLFDFVAMAKWLGDVFKSHCAPMRDLWVLDMISKFQQAFDEPSVRKLVEGLRLIFLILEAMKLDVANHQIRMLRPALIETATDFEKDYFHQLITHCKIDISDSLQWFNKAAQDIEAKLGTAGGVSAEVNPASMLGNGDLKPVLTSAVIQLLLCRNMATEFPLTLAFDHTRLVLLRADVRRLVCVQLCVVLFKQVCMNYAGALFRGLKSAAINTVQEQILAIVTDDNGNVKWTRNVQAIALQLVKNAVNRHFWDDTWKQSSQGGLVAQASVPQHLVDFCYNWLIKQIQPNTDVYGLMEEKIFKELAEQIGRMNHEPPVAACDRTSVNALKQRKADLQMAGISFRISTLTKFHWSVFGDYYAEFVRLQAT